MPVTVGSAGVDTWSPCWWLDPESVAAGHLSEVATASAARGKLLPEPVAGHRIGWHAGSGLLYAEGHPRDGGLCPPGELPAALDRLEQALLDDGVPVPVGVRGEDIYGQRFEGFAGIRRLDSTCDLATGSTAEGLAILAGIAAVARDAPRSKANIWFGRDGKVETVAIHGYGGGRMLGRFYDKGAESGVAERARLLRPEDQRRWDKGYRRDVAELTGAYVREKFIGRFAPLWKASRGVTVAGPVVIAEKLAELVEAKELSRENARNLVGDLVLELAGSRAVRPSKRTRYRHRALMRKYGLVVADGVMQEVEIDLGEILEACMDSEAWGADG